MTPVKQVRLEGKTSIPHLIYGTAFKNVNTARHVREAFDTGFRAFDSAPQTRYYAEELVGKGLQTVVDLTHQNHVPPPGTIFLQTKFTNPSGYNASDMPYTLADSPATQVAKSLQSSLRNLERSAVGVDSFLLHAPFATIEETMLYWRAAETHVPERVRYLGICNVNLEQVQKIYSMSTIKPSIVQNSFRRSSGYDLDLIEWCIAQGVTYQAFSVLHANVDLLESSLVGWLAEKEGITRPQALYALLLSHGDGWICILDGTTNSERMKSDLEVIQRVGKLDDVIVEGFREELRNRIHEEEAYLY